MLVTWEATPEGSVRVTFTGDPEMFSYMQAAFGRLAEGLQPNTVLRSGDPAGKTCTLLFQVLQPVNIDDSSKSSVNTVAPGGSN
jgi:hypothetical protein